jgi:hypothetical protein
MMINIQFIQLLLRICRQVSQYRSAAPAADGDMVRITSFVLSDGSKKV